MKIIITGVVLIAVVALGGAMFIRPNVQEFTAPSIVEKLVEKEVVKSELETRIQDALSASSTEIENEAQEAYEATKSQLRKEIELEVRTAYENELKEERIELEKEVGAF